jgi:sortase A
MQTYRTRIAIMATADRGGPFVHANGSARNWMRAAPPGIGFRCLPRGESSPIGRDRKAIHFSSRWVALCIALLAIVGAASFGSGVYLHAKAQVAQWLLHAAWSESRDSGAPVKPWPWADTHPVARLLVPAQDADVLVLAGASGRTLAFGPGHLDGSAMPGDAGNAVITAHRDTHFRFLRAVSPGDELVVERPDGGMRHFRIRGTYVADYRELRLPRDTAVPTLTLVTCYPFDAVNPGGPLRYVVVAEAA